MSLDSRKAGFTRLVSSSNDVFTIKAHHGLELPGRKDEEIEITYGDLKTIGNGSFGIVFLATLKQPTQEQVAIKKVLQDKRFKNRELQIMRKLDHCNVVKLKYFFHTTGDRNNQEVYLHLVLEYIPETLYKIARTHSRTRQSLPMLLVKLYMYQLFRSLNYIHSRDICHRDIKPQNLLLNPETGVLKLCDFGSAKSLVGGEPNVAYICSRYYRAPELIFGATDYTTKIDIWSAGCVMAELILGEPMFPGESGVDQLVEIIKILGTPTREQMNAMNPNYNEFRFPIIRARSWNRIFSSHLRTPPEAAKLVSNLLEYTPSNRLTPLSACAHPFFDELRSPSTNLLPNGREFPPLFNFSEDELRKEPHLIQRLLPLNQVPDTMTQQQQTHRNTSSAAEKTVPQLSTSSSSSAMCGATADLTDVAASSSTNNDNNTTNSTNTSNQTNNTCSNNDDSSKSGVNGPGLAPNGSPRGQATGTANPEGVNRDTGSNDTNDSPTAQHSHQQQSSQVPR